MTGSRAQLRHIPALDGLRGFAVALILLFHAEHLVGGWIGVDVFFVLSGFLITSLLLREWENHGAIDLWAFWGRRARRLLPALFGLLVVVLVGASFSSPEAALRIRNDALATFFYIANWHAIAAQYDYWAIFSAPSPLDHTWSLAIEEQFYLFWPPIVMGVLARTRGASRAVAITAAALAGISTLAMFLLFDPEAGTARVYFGTDTRVAATLLGAALSGMAAQRAAPSPTSARPLLDAVGGAGLLVLLLASGSLDGGDPRVYRGGLLLVIVASGGLVAAMVWAPSGLVSKAFSWRPLRELGRISYGAYLWHWPLYLVLTADRVGVDGAALTALRVLATLIVSWASYRWIEAPVRTGGVTKRVLGGAALASVGAIVGLALWITAASATDPRSDRGVPPVARPGEPIDLLLIGDSLAQILGPGFIEEASARGLAAEVLGVEACGSLRATGLRYLSGHQFDLSPCLAIRNRWLQAAARRRPKAVIVFEGWTGEGQKRISNEWREPCEPAFDDAYRRDLTDLVERLSAHTEQVVLLSAAPPQMQDLPSRFSRLWGGMPPAELGERFRERVGCQNAVRSRVAREQSTSWLDLETAVCPEPGACRRFDGDVHLRPDGMHFEDEGARWAARWILDRIQLPARP